MNRSFTIPSMTDHTFMLVFNSVSLTFIALVATTLFLLINHVRVLPKYRQSIVILALVNFIAAYFYWKISGSLRSAYTSNTKFDESFRYLDWILTVPLLLTALVKSLGLPRKKRLELIYRLVPSALAMIILGYIGDETVGTGHKLVFWSLSCIPFIYILYVLFIQLTRALDQQISSVVLLVSRVRILVTATWTVYPVVYLMPLLDYNGETAFALRQCGYSLADAAAKCAFSLVIYRLARLNSANDSPEFAEREGLND